MDIGPVRRRLIAEPIGSPVPGEESSVPERPVLQPAPAEHPPARRTLDTVPTTGA